MSRIGGHPTWADQFLTQMYSLCSSLLVDASAAAEASDPAARAGEGRVSVLAPEGALLHGVGLGGDTSRGEGGRDGDERAKKHGGLLFL